MLDILGTRHRDRKATKRFFRKVLKHQGRPPLQLKATFKGTRWLLLKNPWNLKPDQRERLSTLVRWNTPLVRAWYLKEPIQLF